MTALLRPWRWLGIGGPLRLVFKLALMVVLGLVVYYAVTLVQVWLTSRHYDPHPARAIVVMGAAQYDGVPSPDLQARLDEALLLYRQGFAPLVVVTGNKEPGDTFTEAESGRRYLVDHGVPAAAVAEALGDDSEENLVDARSVLAAHGVTGDISVLVVTDPFHEDRSMAIASSLGLSPSPTPTQTSPIRGWSVVPYYLKEALSVSVGRVVGYRRLSELHADL